MMSRRKGLSLAHTPGRDQMNGLSQGETSCRSQDLGGRMRHRRNDSAAPKIHLLRPWSGLRPWYRDWVLRVVLSHSSWMELLSILHTIHNLDDGVKQDTIPIIPHHGSILWHHIPPVSMLSHLSTKFWSIGTYWFS